MHPRFYFEGYLTVGLVNYYLLHIICHILDAMKIFGSMENDIINNMIEVTSSISNNLFTHKCFLLGFPITNNLQALVWFPVL